VFYLESYAESNCYFRKISKFKRLYELLDDLGSVNIKIADLGNACWEVIIIYYILTINSVMVFAPLNNNIIMFTVN